MDTSIDYPVGHQYQSTNNTCWATSTAMLLNYRGGNHDDMAVVHDLQQYYPDSVWNDGATELELGQVAGHYGFTQIHPACWTATGWLEQLQANGPMLIQVPGNSHHSIVVAGIALNTAEDEEERQQSLGGAQVRVLDPWPGNGGDHWMPYEEFEAQYELAGTNWSNNVYRV
jgi:ABC-type bacteriocin/lantibiotic exporter with double-glycine peptidase domain